MAETLDFSQRANLEEEIDGPCSEEELSRCLRHLAVVNRLVYAHGPIFGWLEKIATSKVMKARATPLRIVDVGCGYGDMLRRIERWATRRGVAVALTGVDINAVGLSAARKATSPASKIAWVHGDATTCAETAECDLIIASGMTHHLTEAELVRLLEWMERSAQVGWFICDLHRMPVPYAIFDWAMRGPWWHRFIRPDGLRSIRRSFRAEDWQRLCAAAEVPPEMVEIQEYWPARLCVERTVRVSAS
jgi:SAM-dependent methyltransferase